MILLDTNVLVHYMKGVDLVRRRLLSKSPREVLLPSVVAYELEYGALKLGSGRRRAMTSSLLAQFRQVPFDDRAAADAARIRVELEQRGNTIGPIDLQIAGTALSRGALLITANLQEFSRVKGLRLADWTV